MKRLKIGNAQAFWGDQPGAAARLVGSCTDLDFVTLDYLAEVSLSIMAIQRQRDPGAGFARDFIEVVQSLVPYWKKGQTFRVVTNAGGLNPHGCARASRDCLAREGVTHLQIGVVSGDDVLEELLRCDAADECPNLETGEPLHAVRDRLQSANAYLGAAGIAEALREGADLVITGRVADPSLTVGACLGTFGWKPDDWNRLAAATIAGHLIECGTQVTGGISTDWLDVPEPANLGFPLVEIDEGGDFVVTKPAGAGGKVDLNTVKEQLLYEVGDPGNYLSPDVTVSFLGITLEQVGKNRVRVSGAAGSAPPPTYKVSATWHDGFRAEGMLVVVGHNAVAKARRAGQVVLDRLCCCGFIPDDTCVEVLGTGDATCGVIPRRDDLTECVLRVAVSARDRAVTEAFSCEFAPLVTSGPQGTTGYTSGRPKSRPVFGCWPCLISRDKVKSIMEILR
jgi:hypothetical protein